MSLPSTIACSDYEGYLWLQRRWPPRNGGLPTMESKPGLSGGRRLRGTRSANGRGRGAVIVRGAVRRARLRATAAVSLPSTWSANCLRRASRSLALGLSKKAASTRSPSRRTALVSSSASLSQSRRSQSDTSSPASRIRRRSSEARSRCSCPRNASKPGLKLGRVAFPVEGPQLGDRQTRPANRRGGERGRGRSGGGPWPG